MNSLLNTSAKKGSGKKQTEHKKKKTLPRIKTPEKPLEGLTPG